jgi:RNA recognition motif-containing protein
MGNSEDADKVIQELNGHSMDGRQLIVNEAREGSGGGGHGNRW